MQGSYRGRLAPSPTGLLHLGHARTFWIAQVRARRAEGLAKAGPGTLILRNDDLDAQRFKLDFVDAMLEDLRWLGFKWSEGPDVGGPFGPYSQSERGAIYRSALQQLHRGGHIFPCIKSRRDVLDALSAPHETDDEPVYPVKFRPPAGEPLPALTDPVAVNWRFRVPDGETVAFADGRLGPQSAVAGRDFGDFLVWRKDDAPSYQLACAVDDATMEISEVVRGDDLVKSTFRQILLLRALGKKVPAYYHCPLMNDDKGERLAKRHDALSLRKIRESGVRPEEIIRGFDIVDGRV